MAGKGRWGVGSAAAFLSCALATLAGLGLSQQLCVQQEADPEWGGEPRYRREDLVWGQAHRSAWGWNALQGTASDTVRTRGLDLPSRTLPAQRKHLRGKVKRKDWEGQKAEGGFESPFE